MQVPATALQFGPPASRISIPQWLFLITSQDPFTPSPTPSPKRREEILLLGCPQEKHRCNSQRLPHDAINPVSWALKILCLPLPLFTIRPAPRLATQPMRIFSDQSLGFPQLGRKLFPFPTPALTCHVTAPSLNRDGLEVDSAQEGLPRPFPPGSWVCQGTTSRIALGEGVCSAWESQSFMEQVEGLFDR